MTLAEFFEFLVEESRKLEVEANAYISVFDGIKKLVSQYPDEPLLKKLCLTPDLLDGVLAQAKHAPRLQASRLAKYDSILEILHPNGAPAPTLVRVEKWLEGIRELDWN